MSKQDQSISEINRKANSSATTFRYQEMESYINGMKKLYDSILQFLENSDDTSSEIDFHQMDTNMKAQGIEGDPEEMRQFLQIIASICENHHRDETISKRINKIFLDYKTQIKQTLSNIDIYNIFQNNKNILLFLFQNEIIIISDNIFNEMINKIDSNGVPYCHFFYQELENFIGIEKMKDIKDNLLLQFPNCFDDYENKRIEGENDSFICTLIRNDSVELFIAHVNRFNYSLSSHITFSLFETNSFLIENSSPTLIEYSAFCGSIQIFQYLLMNNVELTPTLWLYSIHSKSAELIQLLETNKVPPPINKDDYTICFIESIKCHHNDFAHYFEINYLSQNVSDSFHETFLKYHNYEYFQFEIIYLNEFFNLCLYNYTKLVNLIIKKKENGIKSKIIFKILYLIKN